MFTIEFRSRFNDWDVIPIPKLKRIGREKAKDFFEKFIVSIYGSPRSVFKEFFEGCEYRLLDKNRNIITERQIL